MSIAENGGKIHKLKTKKQKPEEILGLQMWCVGFSSFYLEITRKPLRDISDIKQDSNQTKHQQNCPSFKIGPRSK